MDFHPAKRPLIMGIVNATPDSFSGDGVLNAEAACDQAVRMMEGGADIIDIGGESSRPGAEPVSAEEEMRRVVPVVELIRKKSGNKPTIAIDTVKANVAEAALRAGANIINDISALQHDPAMPGIIMHHGCPVILMHNRGRTGHIQHDERIGGEYAAADYGDIIEDVKRDLSTAADKAMKAGIAKEKIILDPGIGFGKTVEQNLALIRRIGQIKMLGFPVLIGPSRKSFIGKILDAPVDERLEGTAATVAVSAFLGADIIRVHDVKFMARVARIASAIRSQKSEVGSRQF